MPLTGFPLSKERSVGTDEDRSLLSSLSSSSWTRSTGEKRGGSLGRLGMDLPLTSPAIPAFVHPGRARQLHILQFRFLQSVSLAHRDAAFGFVAPLSPLPPSSLSAFLFLSASSSFVAFFSPLLSSFFLRTSSLSLLGFPPPVLFRSPDHGCPPPPPRPSELVSLVCVCFLCIASRSSLRFPTL